MKIEIYINSLQNPYALEHELTKQELGELRLTESKGLLDFCNSLVKNETDEEFTICYIKLLSLGKPKSVQLLTQITEANCTISDRVMAEFYPEFKKEQITTVNQSLPIDGNLFLLDCLLEDSMAKQEILFLDWLSEMKHPNLKLN